MTYNGVTMCSVRARRWGPDKCSDGDPTNFCRTDEERFPTITLDFGKVVHIATVSFFNVMIDDIDIDNKCSGESVPRPT